MKHTWIQNNNNKLIVFFNGWGCDEHPFKYLKAKAYDIFILYDYRELSLPHNLRGKLEEYEEVNVVAWSYGVWVAKYLWQSNKLPKSKAIAINGTTWPVSKKYGIPENIMQGTLEHLSEPNLAKFQRRMLGGGEAWKKFEMIKPQRNIEDQKEELANLIQHFKLETKEDEFYDKAIIGSKDLIFVADNQKEFWKNKATIKVIDAPHYCFFEYKNWDDLLA